MRDALKGYRGGQIQRFAQIERRDSGAESPGELFSGDSSPIQMTRGISSMDDTSEGDFSSLAVHSRASPSVDELSESLKLPPRLLAQTTSLLGRHPKKDGRKKVDFGFRPDGAGEDSLENWSLFKVSKASTSLSGFGDSVSTGLGLTTSSGFIGDKMRKTETKVRAKRAAVECEFHEYMAQTRQIAEADWRSASVPSLLDPERKRKSLPHLPKLVKSGTSRMLRAAGSTVGFSGKGDSLGSWEKAPPRVSIPAIQLAPSAPKKFGATAPPSALFAKW